MMLKVRKKEKIRNRYSQEPHLTQKIIWESEKNTRKYYKPQPFPSRSPQGYKEQTRQYGRQHVQKKNKRHPQ